MSCGGAGRLIARPWNVREDRVVSSEISPTCNLTNVGTAKGWLLNERASRVLLFESFAVQLSALGGESKPRRCRYTKSSLNALMGSRCRLVASRRPEPTPWTWWRAASTRAERSRSRLNRLVWPNAAALAHAREHPASIAVRGCRCSASSHCIARLTNVGIVKGWLLKVCG